MATMATNHVTVAMGQVATTILPRYRHFFISNYIIPSHYDQMLFFSVHELTPYMYVQINLRSDNFTQNLISFLMVF